LPLPDCRSGREGVIPREDPGGCAGLDLLQTIRGGPRFAREADPHSDRSVAFSDNC
jgi:hypothetical protein